MRKVKYIGNRDRKVDNVAGTNTVWLQGEVKDVTDTAADKLLAYPSVWAEQTAEPQSERTSTNGEDINEPPKVGDQGEKTNEPPKVGDAGKKTPK